MARGVGGLNIRARGLAISRSCEVPSVPLCEVPEIARRGSGPGQV